MAKFSFANAKTTEAPKKDKKSKTVAIEMRNVKAVGALDWLINAATTVKDLFMADLKADMETIFVENGVAKGSKPDNFQGVEDGATASCQLRKRSTRSVLSDADVAALEEHNIPFGTETSTIETFVFNPYYLGNAEIMGKIEAALARIPGLPEDIIQHQAGVTTRVVTDETVDAIFKLSAEDCAKLLPVVTTPAVSPKFEVIGGDVGPVMAEVSRIMNLPELKETIANAKKKSSRNSD